MKSIFLNTAHGNMLLVALNMAVPAKHLAEIAGVLGSLPVAP